MVDTPHFQIIFSKDAEKQAQRLANTLEYLFVAEKKTLQAQPKKISIVLRNQQAIPNGYISLAPRKGEFFCFPTQDHHFLGNTDWLDLLAVHELRHIMQFAKSSSKFHNYLVGEFYRVIYAHLIIPSWCWEGDAVCIETALTKGGRGRLPRFSIRYKINTLNQCFSYDKQVLGSYRHFIQNHYTFGYHFIAYLRRHYGKDIVNTIWENAFSGFPFYPVGIFKFSKAIKKATNKTLLALYADMQEEMKLKWEKQISYIQPTPVKTICSSQNNFLYKKPQTLKNGTVIALKQGLGHVSTFVQIDVHGKEKLLYYPADIIGTQFSIANNKIIWNARVKHAYKQHTVYAVVKQYDLKTKKLKILTKKSRYQSACLSPNGKKIVAVATNEKYEHALVILNAINGKLIKKIDNPENVYYFSPAWSADNNTIIFIKCYNNQKSICTYRLSTGNESIVLPYQKFSIGNAIFCAPYILYEAAYTGVDAIYALHCTTKKIYQVAIRKYGVYYPFFCAKNKTIIFSDYVENGVDLVKIPFEPQKWKCIGNLKNIGLNIHKNLIDQENNSHILGKIAPKIYPIKKYNFYHNIINFHSQSMSLDLNNHLKIVSFSNDILGTTDIQLGYYKGIFWNILYKNCYPNIGISSNFCAIKQCYSPGNNINLLLSFPYHFSPTSFTRKFFTNMSFCYFYEKNQLKFQKNLAFSFHHMFPKSSRDIYPSWGQLFSLHYSNKLRAFNFDNINIKISTYWPGLLPNHGFLWKTMYNIKSIRPFFFKYVFPIWYPDKGIDLWLYIKKMWGKVEYNNYNLSTFLCTDLYILNIDFPISLHCGVTYNSYDNIFHPQFFFKTNFSMKKSKY